MADAIAGYVKRPVGYMYVDGIYEMFIGIIFLGWALLDPVWIIVLIIIAYGGTHVMKKRITYPRTGYVKLQSYAKKAWLGGIAGAGVALAVFIFFRGGADILNILLISVIWAFLYAYISKLAKLESSWRWVVALAMIAGPVFILMLPMERRLTERMGLGFVGLLFLLSGAITFAHYMRRTQPPKEEAA